MLGIVSRERRGKEKGEDRERRQRSIRGRSGGEDRDIDSADHASYERINEGDGSGSETRWRRSRDPHHGEAFVKYAPPAGEGIETRSRTEGSGLAIPFAVTGDWLRRIAGRRDGCRRARTYIGDNVENHGSAWQS